jgi:hypothetical protein
MHPEGRSLLMTWVSAQWWERFSDENYKTQAYLLYWYEYPP